jgi:hypothetical protein
MFCTKEATWSTEQIATYYYQHKHCHFWVLRLRVTTTPAEKLTVILSFLLRLSYSSFSLASSAGSLSSCGSVSSFNFLLFSFCFLFASDLLSAFLFLNSEMERMRAKDEIRSDGL